MAELRQNPGNAPGIADSLTRSLSARWTRRDGQRMVRRLTKAVPRALLMALLVATPALLLPSAPAESKQIVVFLGLVAALFTFVEYYAVYPSIVEFRHAPPFNRIRFLALWLTVIALAVILRGKTDPTTMTRLFAAMGERVAGLLDFPYSPVRLVVLMLPHSASPALVDEVRTAAGLSYLISILSLGVFVAFMRLAGWPARHKGFNFWVNLPTFDPTAGGDVVARLNRDSQINLILGLLLPFLIPATVKLAADIFDPVRLTDPQTLIWTMTAWAFLPASLLMRGMALARVAKMIAAQRQRARDGSAVLQPV